MPLLSDYYPTNYQTVHQLLCPCYPTTIRLSSNYHSTLFPFYYHSYPTKLPFLPLKSPKFPDEPLPGRWMATVLATAIQPRHGVVGDNFLSTTTPTSQNVVG